MTPSQGIAPTWRPGRRLVLAALAAVVAALAISSFATWRDRDRSDLDRAQQLVSRDVGFDSGLEAGETLARVAQHLESAVDECRGAARGTSCQALSSALGYSQVLAAFVLECPAPGRFEARERMADYLEEVAVVPRDSRRVPGPPPRASSSGTPRRRPYSTRSSMYTNGSSSADRLKAAREVARSKSKRTVSDPNTNPPSGISKSSAPAGTPIPPAPAGGPSTNRDSTVIEPATA